MPDVAIASWASEELSRCPLKDRRVHQRLLTMLEAAGNQPTASLPSQMGGWTETQGAYRFFNSPRVTPAAVLAPHTEATAARAAEHSRVLWVQDTTEIECTKREVAGAGVLSWDQRRGFLAHVHYLVTPAQLPLGVVGLETWARQGGRRRSQARKREPYTRKESARWGRGYAAACAWQRRQPQTQVRCVADREADIYELLQAAVTEAATGGAHLIVRAKSDRMLLDAQGQVRPTRLFATLAQAPLLGYHQVTVPATKDHPERTATLALRAATVTLRPPYRRGAALPPLRLQALVACEQNPPPEIEEPICWYLLTTLPVATLAQAIELVADYAGRWSIEVLFRTLKTGCRIEQRQLATLPAMERALSFYLILAWRLCHLTHLARVAPAQPCTRCFSQDEWQALYQVQRRRAPPPEPPSLGDFMLLLAKAGGYLARRHDPPPGVQYLWQGLTKLMHLTEAWRCYRTTHP